MRPTSAGLRNSRWQVQDLLKIAPIIVKDQRAFPKREERATADRVHGVR